MLTVSALLNERHVPSDHSAVCACIAVPKDAVDQLWESFNDVAEGFGLSIEEFLEITRTALKEHMELSDKKIDQVSAKAFGIFDDDKVGVSSFAMLNGASYYWFAERPRRRIRVSCCFCSDIRHVA